MAKKPQKRRGRKPRVLSTTGLKTEDDTVDAPIHGLPTGQSSGKAFGLEATARKPVHSAKSPQVDFSSPLSYHSQSDNSHWKALSSAQPLKEAKREHSPLEGVTGKETVDLVSEED